MAAALQSSFVRDTLSLDDRREREFLWACTLTKDSPTVTWPLDECYDDLEETNHILFLRNAVLRPGAADGERNVVEVKTTDFMQKEVKAPLVSLTLGQADMASLDLNFGYETPVTLRLVLGSGPVQLVGQHLVQHGEAVQDADSPVSLGSARRRALKRKGCGIITPKSKRTKLDYLGSSGEDENEDEEDDEDEVVYSLQEEKDEEDDEEEEEEEEEEAPVKRAKAAAKQQAVKAKPKVEKAVMKREKTKMKEEKAGRAKKPKSKKF